MVLYIMEAEIRINIEVGTKFKDLVRFEEDLKKTCQSNFVQFYKREARTIKSAINKNITRYLNPALKFYSIRWCCVHGGRKHQTRSKGMRKSNTLRKDDLCPAYIHVRVDESGDNFIVAGVNYKHNHVVTLELFKQLPHNRRSTNKMLHHFKAKKRLQIKSEFEADCRENDEILDQKDVEVTASQILDNTSHVVEGKYKETFLKARLIASLASGVCEETYCKVNAVLDAIINDLHSGENDFVTNAAEMIHVNDNCDKDEASEVMTDEFCFKYVKREENMLEMI